MAKKITPIITHTEIICHAIRAIEADIADWKNRCERIRPADADKLAELDELAANVIANLNPKLEALKEMYRFETGLEYRR